MIEAERLAAPGHSPGAAAAPLAVPGAPRGGLSASYARLPPRFFARLDPTPVAAPALVRFNAVLAAELGLELPADALELAQLFSGNRLLPGSVPVAMAYAGHQFGHFVPQLGDGRAILLGERCMATGDCWDIQLKGSGQTPFSRSGDGRAALGPVLREYIVSEAMFALGIPSTRALAAVVTGEVVYRERALPGAVFTRVAASHVRVGTFEYFAARGDVEATRALADFVIERHYPELKTTARPYLELLRVVILRQARLVAQWMAVGFIHGVMNTDNMTVSGQSIDFGPCAFMDSYHPDTVFSSIDQRGRYAYGNQPAAAQWNLARFAETLLPLVGGDAQAPAETTIAEATIAEVTGLINGFTAIFEDARRGGMLVKLGLSAPLSGDEELLQRLLTMMQEQRADFTLTFRALCEAAVGADAPLRAALGVASALDSWLMDWRARLSRESRSPAAIAAGMRRVNPKYIARNHRVEQAIVAATDAGDYAPFHRLVEILSRPFDEQPESEEYAKPPQPDERVLRTFCGT